MCVCVVDRPITKYYLLFHLHEVFIIMLFTHQSSDKITCCYFPRLSLVPLFVPKTSLAPCRSMGRHLQYGGATVVVIRALVIGIVFLFAEQLTAAQNTKKCWIFTHMNKSGGSSIKKLLRPWMEHNNVTQGSYDSQQWTAGMGYARGYIKMGNTITWGGYTEGLRPYGAQKAQHCKWFTMFRQ